MRRRAGGQHGWVSQGYAGRAAAAAKPIASVRCSFSVTRWHRAEIISARCELLLKLLMKLQLDVSLQTYRLERFGSMLTHSDSDITENS
jgi:hypothetical protein